MSRRAIRRGEARVAARRVLGVSRMDILVWFGETGRTGTHHVVKRIAERFRARGYRAAQATSSPALYDAVVIGAPAWRERPPDEVVEYVERHRSVLATRPTAFFTVGDAPDRLGRQYATAADHFFQRIGWHPQCAASLASSWTSRAWSWLGLDAIVPLDAAPDRRALDDFVDDFSARLAYRARAADPPPVACETGSPRLRVVR